MRRYAAGSLIVLLIGTSLPFAMARATGVDDANGAVLAARAGNFDESIRLFTAALRSNELPAAKRAQALSYRGISYAANYQYDSALTDLDSAVALDSTYNADAYSYRGFVKMTIGETGEAAEDLAKGADLLVWSYNALWLYLARARAGLPDTGARSLANNAATLDLEKWPGPVIRLFLGQATPDAVRMAANMGDAATSASRVCDVNFYLGELSLVHHDAAAAKPLFESAAKDCPFSAFERTGAAAELTHIGK